MYGSKLKELIVKHTGTQREMAHRLGIPDMTVSGWTRQEYPPLKNIDEICKNLNLQLWEFFAPDKMIDNVQKICKLFQVSYDDFRTGQALDIQDLTAEQIEWLQMYNRLTPDIRRKLVLLITSCMMEIDKHAAGQ